MRRIAPLLVALSIAAPAEASTLTWESDSETDEHNQTTVYTRILLTGTDGPDRVTATWESGAHVLHDPAGLEGEARDCQRVDATTVRCPGNFARALDATLGGGDDVLKTVGFFHLAISGGAGDDRIEAHGGRLSGGPGADVLVGVSDGGETMDGGPGPDVLDPAAGAARTGSPTATAPPA